MSETSTVVRTGEQEWQALKTPGVSIKVLRADKATGESTTLLRFDAGATFPAHIHPAGEEIFVIAGDFKVGPEHLRSGDYLYTPPAGKHAASTDNGCLVLVTLRKPVEILVDG